ncbi:MAG: hypothetical protein JSS75_06030 [Bacteroidetes bacterium]|nr:hypothetical protein [Bacteroidota bacterium]
MTHLHQLKYIAIVICITTFIGCGKTDEGKATAQKSVDTRPSSDSMMTPPPAVAPDKSNAESAVAVLQAQVDSLKRITDGKEEKSGSATKLGYIADVMTQMRRFNEMVENEEMFAGREYTFSATVKGDDKGQPMETKDESGIMVCVGNMFPDGIIFLCGQNGTSYKTIPAFTHLKAGDNVAFTGKFMGVYHIKSAKAPAAVITASVGKKMD